MDTKQDNNVTKKSKVIEMAAVKKSIAQARKQISNAEQKVIIHNATIKALERYDEVFKKLSKN